MKHIFTRLLTIFLLSSLGHTLVAQKNVTITGKVIDKATTKPMEFVTVAIYE